MTGLLLSVPSAAAGQTFDVFIEGCEVRLFWQGGQKSVSCLTPGTYSLGRNDIPSPPWYAFPSITATIAQLGPKKFSISAHAEAVSTINYYEQRSPVIAQHELRISINNPSRLNLVLRAKADTSVAWNRGDAGDPGSAYAGLHSEACGGLDIGSGSDSSAQGSSSQSGVYRSCVYGGTGEFGWTRFAVDASVNGEAAHPQSMDAQKSVEFEVLLLGKEIVMVDEAATNNQQGFVGQKLPLPLKVLVRQDDTLAPAAGIPVVFTVKDKNGAVTGTVNATTLADGIATAEIPLGATVGAYTVEAVCSQCVADHQMVTYAATAIALETMIVKIQGEEGGDGQKNLVGSQLPIPLRLKVVRSDGSVVQGVPVTLSVIEMPSGASPGSFSDAAPVTDTDGIVASLYTLGSLPGTYRIRAFCGACDVHSPNEQVLIAKVSDGKPADKPKTKKDRRADPPQCPAEILQVSGEAPPPPPQSMLTCVGADTQLQCYGELEQPYPADRGLCTYWRTVPTVAGVSVSADTALGANFRSDVAGEFTVMADYHGPGERRYCTPERTITVAATRVADMDFPVWLEPMLVPRGNQTHDLHVNLAEGAGVRIEDLWKFVDVSIVALDWEEKPLPMTFGTIRQGSATPTKLTYSIEFPCLPKDERPSFFMVHVQTCGGVKDERFQFFTDECAQQ